MALYNKGESGVDATQTLIGNWQEERILYSMTNSSRKPTGHDGMQRCILHRDEEKAADYRSTSRSNFCDPGTAERSGVAGPRAAARERAIRAFVDGEEQEQDALEETARRTGTYAPTTASTMVAYPSEVLVEQKQTGLFVRSNKFIDDLATPRTDVSNDEVVYGPYDEAPAITKWSFQEGGAVINGDFKVKEDSYDAWPSAVWGHGTQGAMAQARGT
jgi:hypothetical protein